MSLLPNLIIPGAPKSATTSLVEYFTQHDDIFIPGIKEPQFFIADTIQKIPATDPMREDLFKYSTLTEQEYNNLYKGGAGAKYRCDASTQYLFYHDTVIPAIKKYLNDPTIIILLRNPVQRAFSHYNYLKGETLSFEEAIKMEQQRAQQGWNAAWLYVAQGLYHEMTKHYMNAFSKVKVVLMDDLSKNGNEVMHDIFTFLEVPPIPIDTKVHNKSGVPPNKFIEWLIFNDNVLRRISRPVLRTFYNTAQRAKIQRKVEDKFVKKTEVVINEQTYNNLVDVFSEDILKLQDLIKQDLSRWLKKK